MRETLATLHAAGFPGVTDAQLALFQNLETKGARLTDLAARAGLTKQSMIELVDRAETADLVERFADPGDRRAKIVCFTARGEGLLHALRAGVSQAEHTFETAVGTPFADEIRIRLRDYIAVARTTPPGDAIERVLGDAADHFVRNVIGAVHLHGYRDIGETLLALFRNLDLDGSRLTDIAARARMTKQSMRELIERAEQLGYVDRTPDSRDGRAKTIRFTDAGLLMLDSMRQGVFEAESRFAARADQVFLDQLKAGLTRYLELGAGA